MTVVAGGLHPNGLGRAHGNPLALHVERQAGLENNAHIG
jgi:hypothetical protein